MQRIPNPGSDITIFLRIFTELHEELRGRSSFGLDDITRAMIVRNNVSSQGAIGEEALRRSTRTDRSRDPLYNQSKMYAELFRTLGWIQSTTSKLIFTFSWLGEHIATARNPKSLVNECLLGISYPNDVLGVQSDQSICIFGSILRAMERLENRISRDEMIAGPLNIDDDRNARSFDEMVSLIMDCRRRPAELRRVIARMEEQRRITKTTMENYTRFPIGAIQWAGWAVKQNGSFVLTDYGREVLGRLNVASDIRLSDYKRLPTEAKPAFIRYSFYKMLGRSGFDLEPVTDRMHEDEILMERLRCLPEGEILFSPFQQISRDEVNSAFPETAHNGDMEINQNGSLLDEYENTATDGRPPITTILFEIGGDENLVDTEAGLLDREIRLELETSRGDIDDTVEALFVRYSRSNQDVFYPLVSNLFRILGFDCRKSRQGVNYERADAMIVDPVGSIPIEIKSPGEEVEISVKAVRQALENKIVLMSRRSYPCIPETTSLVVGYNAPNERSEVHELIEDIHTTFNVKVGVIDFRSLLKLAVTTIAAGRRVVLPEFTSIKGVIRVESFTSSH